MTRIAVVDNSKLKDKQKKEYIQGLCPVNRKGEDCIYFEGEKLRIDEGLCIGCGICSNAVPEAIDIINLPEQLEKDPIHRYGKNAFALYNLPAPIFGNVVGVIGVNGIGKSTAIKILANVLKPNLGKEKDADIKEIIDYFKGTETQLFFDKVKKGDIKTAYKPQHVDKIPKQYNGKVIDLLNKVDEIGKVDEMIEKFDIRDVNRKASAFNTEKLDWLNQQYMKSLPADEVAAQLLWQFEQAGLAPENGPPLTDLVRVQADRVKTLREMTGQSRVFYENFDQFDPGAAKKHLRPVAEQPLRAIGSRLADLAIWEPERLDEIVRLTAEELEVGMGKIAQPLRVALTGTAVSPSIDKTLWLTGRDRSLARIARALEYVLIRAAAT